MLGLRTRFGAELSAPESTFGPMATVVEELVVSRLVDPQVHERGTRLVLTRRGRLLGNEVASRLLLARDAATLAGTR